MSWSALYGAYAAGGWIPLPAVAVQYAVDYAVWQRTWVEWGGAGRRRRRIGGRRRVGAPEVLMLPTDRPRPAEQDSCGGGRWGWCWSRRGGRG